MVSSTALIEGSIPTGPTDRRDRHPRAYSTGPKSSTFFTPYTSRSVAGRKSSPSESEASSLSDISEELLAIEDRKHEYIRKAKDAMHQVFKMLFINEAWKMEREERDDITVQSRFFEGIGKVYKMESVVDCPSVVLGRLFWEDVESQPSWNPNVMECQIFERLNQKTEIIYSTASEAAGGLISPRDFVTVRRRKRKGPLHLNISCSVDSKDIPVKPNVIRAHNGPGGWVMRDIPGEPNKSEFIWLLNTDLKGWIPQRVIDSSIAGVMVDTTRSLRNHVLSLPPQ